MVNLERYIAIKHALRYETIVTEKRLTCLSALLWIILLTITVSLSFFDENTYLKVDTITLSLCITTIIFCQVVLYHETRRHQKEIAAGQFSMEAREKFLREKKAFILTTMILFSLILCYLPFTVARILNTNIKVCHQFSQFSIHSPIYRQNSGSFQLDDQPDHLLCTN